MSLFPAEATATAFADLGALSGRIGQGNAVIPALEVATGALGNNTRNLGLLPPAVLRAAIAAAEIEVTPANPATGAPAVRRHFTPVEASQVGLAWRIARRIQWAASGQDWNAWLDQDPLEATPVAQAPPPPQQGEASAVPPRRIRKTSSAHRPGGRLEIRRRDVQGPEEDVV